MPDDQPFFRFHPDAYRAGRAFDPSDERCDCCGLACVWKYTGLVYTARETPVLCARCIAEDRLLAWLGEPHFSLHDAGIAGADPALADEIRRRTPGFASFNPFEWPVLDGMPMAFLGYGEDEPLFALPEVRAALAEAFEPLGWSANVPSPYGLVFKALDGPAYRVVIDLD